LFSYFKKKIYRKIALLFLVATLTLVFSSYYVINWSFETKDTILDVHDAYFHIKLVQSWGSLDDTLSLEQELNNLSIFGYIYYLDSDTLCENSVLYWTNHEFGGVDPCGYGSYTDTDYFLTQYPEINFRDYYVSLVNMKLKKPIFLQPLLHTKNINICWSPTNQLVIVNLVNLFPPLYWLQCLC
jgi:hypothetical protein